MPRFLIDLDAETIAWLDAEAERLERSRSWLVGHFCKLEKGRKERAKARRAAKAGDLLNRLDRGKRH